MIDKKIMLHYQNYNKKIIIQNYYENLYDQEELSEDKMKQYLEEARQPKVPEVVRTILNEKITMFDLTEAIKRKKNNKTPGPDALRVEVYKQLQVTLGPSMLEVYNEVLLEAKIPKPRIGANITLIPKKDADLLQIKNYRFSTTDEKKWRELRHFTLSTLRDFGMGKKRMSERVQEEALCLVEEMATKKGKPFDPRRNVTSAVSNVIYAVVFGNRLDYKNHTFIENQQIMESQIRFLASFLGMVYNTFPKIMEYFPGKHIKSFAESEKLCGYIREEVELHKKTWDPQNLRDYIDCFLLRLEKDQNSSEGIYSPEELVFTVYGLFAAGTVTTGHTLLCSLLAMAKLQHIQAKVQQEIDEVVGTNRTPSMEDRLKMPFTNAVVHEVQRYQIGSAESFPRATTCDVKFHGYNIPKCIAVAPILPSLHYDPLHWETPEKFNPDHFLDEKGQFRKRDAFMPFSAGKRACPGEALARMELFLFFSTLLQRFTFYLDGDTKDTDVMSLFMALNNKTQCPLIQAVKRSVNTCVE
ncbi:cytochrome P450 2C15-like [Thamnophis elegans]|uniref:cytochrome P450 2C15-like n=1 Tax=Thamnophis elegans TaxID=35005 RepID=UPI00137814E7|nr:cytochrome P450 2C15-like [Thamnophis elegans]